MPETNVGVSVATRNGEFVINNVAKVRVPIMVKVAIKKAANAAKQGIVKSAKTVGTGIENGVRTGQKLARTGAKMVGQALVSLVDINVDQMHPGIKSYLYDLAVGKAANGKSITTGPNGSIPDLKAPEVKGHKNLGGSLSTATVNKLGLGAFIPFDGDVGAYIWIDEETKSLSGVMATIKWVKPASAYSPRSMDIGSGELYDPHGNAAAIANRALANHMTGKVKK